MKKCLLLAMTFIINAQIGFCANEAYSKELSGAMKTHSSEPNIFSIAMALLFVVCLIYVTGLIYAKLNVLGSNTVRKQIKNYDLSRVVVLSTTQLGQGKNLHVVEVNKKKFLISATPNAINLVKEFDEFDSDAGIEEELNIIEGVADSVNDGADEEVLEEFNLHKKYL